LRIQGHGIGILQVEFDGRVGGNIKGAGLTGEHGLHLDRTAVEPRADNRRAGVRIIRRIRGADVYLAAAKDEIVIAAAVQRRAEGIVLLLVSFRVDDHEIGIGILVLKRPEQMGRRINFESIVMTLEGVRVFMVPSIA